MRAWPFRILAFAIPFAAPLACGARSELLVEGVVTGAAPDASDAVSSSDAVLDDDAIPILDAEPPPDAGVPDASSPDGGDGSTCWDRCQPPDIPAPRAIAPLSTATVTSQRPLLHWILAAGDDGAEVDICRDRACTAPVTSFAAPGTSGAPAAPLKAGVYFWRLHGTSSGAVGAETSPVWEFFVGAASAPVNASWGTVLDVNGDGLGDVVVGAPENAVVAKEAVAVYLGSSGGPTVMPVVLTQPGTMFANFGGAVASAGDVNGDGFADLLVGASRVSGFQGGAYLYLGGASGLASTPAVTLSGANANDQLGAAVAGAGDVNGDGFADVLVTAYGASAAYVYLGSAGGLSTTPISLVNPIAQSQGSYFGFDVASAGDLNGDGFADIVAGSLYGSNGKGAAFVYMGSASGPSTSPVTLTAPVAVSEYFGSSAACIGDVNGDGYADIVIGTTSNVSYAGPTQAYVYLGGALGLSSTPVTLGLPSVLAGQIPSSSLSFAGGDLNGDGFADLVVGTFYDAGDRGTASVYLGGPAGLSTTPTVLPAPSGSPGDFGVAGAGAGDVNGDGLDDFIVGADGAAYVYLGAKGRSPIPVGLSPPAGTGHFGWVVGG